MPFTAVPSTMVLEIFRTVRGSQEIFTAKRRNVLGIYNIFHTQQFLLQLLDKAWGNYGPWAGYGPFDFLIRPPHLSKYVTNLLYRAQKRLSILAF